MKKETQKHSADYTVEPEISTLSLTDLVDIDMLQHLQDSFAQAFNMPSIIYGPDGTPITKSSCFTSFCALVRSTKEGAERCEKFDAELIRSLQKTHEPIIRYGCALNNMVTGTVPIIIQGKHIANWGIGQLLNQKIDVEEISQYATTIGVDQTDLLAAAQKLIPFNKKHFLRIMPFLQVLSDQISMLGFKNLQQSTEIIKRKKAERLLQQKTDNLKIAIEKLQSKEQDIKDKNIALRVLLDQKQATRDEFEEEMTTLLQKRVYPYLELLQQDVADSRQKEYLVLIKAHLDSINDSFIPKINNPIWNLTQRETLVADLVKQGKKSAEISNLLKISTRTAEKYRQNIRKKIGLAKKKISLYEYLNHLSSTK